MRGEHFFSANNLEAARARYPVKGLERLELDSSFGGLVVVQRFQPEGAAQTAENKPPVLFRAGVGGRKTNALYARELAAQGRDAFSVDIIGDRVPDEGFFSVAYTKEGKAVIHEHKGEERKMLKGAYRAGGIDMIIPKQIVREAASVLAASEQVYGSRKIDAVFQSKDATNGLLALNGNSERFGTVTFAYPSIIGNNFPSNYELLGIVREGLRKPFYNLLKPEKIKQELAREPYQYPVFEREAKNVNARANTRGLIYGAFGQLLHAVRAQEGEIPNILLVLGNNDRIFPTARTLSGLLSSMDVDRILVTGGGHGLDKQVGVIGHVLNTMEDMDEHGTDLSMPLSTRMHLPNIWLPGRVRFLQKTADMIDTKAHST
jgi:hypothetical protein